MTPASTRSTQVATATRVTTVTYDEMTWTVMDELPLFALTPDEADDFVTEEMPVPPDLSYE